MGAKYWGALAFVATAFLGGSNLLATTDELREGYFPIQWNLLNTGSNEPISLNALSGEIQSPRADIHFVEAMKIFKPKAGQRKPRIVLIDSGVDPAHPDFQGCLWTNEAEAKGQPKVDDDKNGVVDDIHGYSFIDQESSIVDFTGHGTTVAGIICSKPKNGVGVTGIMPEVDIIPAKVIGSRYAEGYLTTPTSIAVAMDYAIDMDADVVHMSMGSPEFEQKIYDAIKRLEAAGIPLVVSANNSGSLDYNQDDYPDYPSHYAADNIIVVTAHDARNLLARWGAYGPQTVDIAAPGTNLITTSGGGGYERRMTANSLAAPHVTAALGLLIAQEGRMPLKELKERLFETTTPVPDLLGKITTGGRLNLENLLLNKRVPRLTYPQESEWQTFKLSDPIHLVVDQHDVRDFKKTFTIPGAKWIRAVIKYADSSGFTYPSYIRYPTSLEIVDSYTGQVKMRKTYPMQSDSLEFVFPHHTANWSLTIEELEYVK